MNDNLNSNRKGRMDPLKEVDKSINIEFGSLEWFAEYSGSDSFVVPEIESNKAIEEIRKLREKINKGKELIDVYVMGLATDEEIRVVEEQMSVDLLFRQEVELQRKKSRKKKATRVKDIEALEFISVGCQQIGRDLECELEIVNKKSSRSLYVDFSNISFNNEDGKHCIAKKITWSDHEKCRQRFLPEESYIKAIIQFGDIVYSKSVVSWIKIPVELSSKFKIIAINKKENIKRKVTQ